jgi:pimeloyl-ACP methyl ester carboxylesterase
MSTQADVHELIELLRGEHDVITFDLRGHGLTSFDGRLSFDTLLADVAAVMAHVSRLELTSAPVLVGHSLGADLMVHYAARYPDTFSEVVVIDGANPIPAPFITAADRPMFRTLWENFVQWQETVTNHRHQVRLSAQQILDLNIELDGLRHGILERYREIDCAVRMIMATSMAGLGEEGSAARYNRLWRAGIDRLIRDQPHIDVTWIDATHALVITHAAQIAQIIGNRVASERPAGE